MTAGEIVHRAAQSHYNHHPGPHRTDALPWEDLEHWDRSAWEAGARALLAAAVALVSTVEDHEFVELSISEAEAEQAAARFIEAHFPEQFDASIPAAQLLFRFNEWLEPSEQLYATNLAKRRRINAERRETDPPKGPKS